MNKSPPVTPDWRLCVAPMMQRTDRHFRYLARLVSPRARLYTEMVTSAAVVHGDRDYLLGHDPGEHPLALQLGGSDAGELARACTIAADYGYDEVNLNCGCPSDRVQAGAFGACLMRDPVRVSDCVAAMREALPAHVPVSVKTRLGVDELYHYDYFRDFIERVAVAGCEVFVVHARKAWLAGLSPRENREIPPLEYDWVYRLKRERPDLTVVINGGIGDVEAARAHAARVDGVMLGRHAYAVPFDLALFEAALYPSAVCAPKRRQVVEAYLRYAATREAAGTPRRAVMRHLLNVYQGCRGARAWRRGLDSTMQDRATPLTTVRGLSAGMPD